MRREQLQAAARQKVAATLAQSNARNRVYGGQSSEGRKPGGPRRSRGKGTSKPTPAQDVEQEGAKAMVKPATSTASNLPEGKYYDFLLLFLYTSLPLLSFLLPHFPSSYLTIFISPSVYFLLPSFGSLFLVQFLPCFILLKSKL